MTPIRPLVLRLPRALWLTPLLWGLSTAAAALTELNASIGEVGPDRALLWVQGDGPGELRLKAAGKPEQGLRLDPAADFSAKVELAALTPDTAYRYRLVARDNPRVRLSGRFVTAPAAADPAPLSFAWGGCLGGQNACRAADRGYPIFETIRQAEPDFFIGLGDMIYADTACLDQGLFGNPQIPGPATPATDLAGFRAHWRYNRADLGQRALLGSRPYYAVWDDHEVVNDFGPLHDAPPAEAAAEAEHLMPAGLAAFLEQNPLRPAANTPLRLYRKHRWGRHLELFLLDTRQYRDSNAEADDPQHPKTLLGREQRTWLEQGLSASDATWKLVVSSVPLSVPTGFPPENGRDGWSGVDQDTGFQQEARGILRYARDAGVRNMLWIATDAHFAAAYRYRPFPETPDFSFHEVVTGPLSALPLPDPGFDASLGTEQLFSHAPESLDQVFAAQPAQALEWFNFGHARIDAQGRLRIEVINAKGARVAELELTPQ